MRKKTTATFVIGLIITLTLPFIAIAATDAPHNASNNISCGSCHGETIMESPFWGTGTYDQLCLSCHRRATGGPYSQTDAPAVTTHYDSSENALAECRDCHNPHYQRQKVYKNTDASNLYLATGKITSCEYTCPVCPQVVGKTTLTYSTNPPITYKSSTGWDLTKLAKKTGDYRRTILFPNVNKLGYSYPIIAVDTPTANTITVDGNAAAFLCSSQTYTCDPLCCDPSCPPNPPPKTYTCNLTQPTDFAVLYGQYIKDYIDVSGTNTATKFFDKAGAKSFADGDTTYNGVCEVCHKQTKYFRYDGGVLDQIHTDKVRTNCTNCHSHVDGFKPSCKACHGYPPTVNAPASPDGLMWVLPYTGSTTAGTHSFHATTSGRNYSCDVCHYQNIVQTGKHNTEPRNITMGFYMFDGTYQGGSYDGQILSSADYDATTTSPSTSVSKLGSKKCSNIYCHGRIKVGAVWEDLGGGTDMTPQWDGSVACGTCHGASTGTPPTRGSHPKHAGSTMQLLCSDCHKGYTPTTIPSGMNTHINNEANFAFDTTKNNIGASASYNGTITMLDAYGQCSKTYCHGLSTPTWGGASIACNGCHGATNDGNLSVDAAKGHAIHYNKATAPTILSQADDFTSSYAYGCQRCHPTTEHVDGPYDSTGPTLQDADISLTDKIATYTQGGSSTTDSKGFNYTVGSGCTTVCHTRTGNIADSPLTAPLWNGAKTTPNCGVCHNKAGDTSPVWSTPHTRHINTYSINTNFTCNACHSGTATNNTTINGAAGRNQHPNGVKDVSFNTFAGGTWTGTQCSNIYCHGNGTTLTPTVGPVSWSGTYTLCSECHGNVSSLATGSHTKHLNSGATCDDCHNATASGNTTIGNYANHVNKSATINFNAASGTGSATYNIQNAGGVNVYQKGIATAVGNCTSIICHSDGTSIYVGGTGSGNTVNWGLTGTCYNCHGNQVAYTDYRRAAPLYASGSPKPNAHQLHIRANGSTQTDPQCANCHSSTTTTNTTITGTVHTSGAYNVTAGAPDYRLGSNVGSTGPVTVTYLYKDGGAGPSSCSVVSCHPTGITANKTVWSTSYKCTECHKINMNNTTGYHHVMDSNAMADRTYPTSVPANNADDANRKCTMCHVDHDIFSPMLNANNTNGRSYNLRTAIGTTPTPTTGYTNSDYATGGGICISCHSTELSKNTTARKDDGTTVAMAVTNAYYSSSLHQYNVESTMTNGSSKFNANCSKCHNAKNNETPTFQSSTNTFGTHDKTLRRLYASLGMTSPTDPEEEDFCYRCHSSTTDTNPGGGPAKAVAGKDYYGVADMRTSSEGIFAVFGKANKHDVGGYSGRHKPSATDDDMSVANRHVECCDCHNPHTIGGVNPDSPEIHPTVGVTRNSNGNQINNTNFGSKALQGVWGVDVSSWPSRWTQPTSFILLKPPTYPNGAEKEYQICFKCHSYYAWGAGYGVDYDIAWQFNPKNRSAHPVVVTLNDQTGSVSPRALTADQMKPPWKGNVGNTTMYCSDCHGNNAYSATDPQGPHGSTRDNLLTDFRRNGQRYYWPKTPSGDEWSLAHILYDQEDWQNTLLCAACHPIKTSDGFVNRVHVPGYHNSFLERGWCSNCHQKRIHGWNNSRFIGGDGTKVLRITKRNLTDYGIPDCGSLDAYCGGTHPGY